MTCSYCGENNNDEAQFCKSCGLSVSKKDSPTVIALQGETKQSIFSRVGGTALGLIAIVVIYGVVNGVMWFGQEVYHHDDNVRLEQMETKLNDLKSKITSLETRMQLNGATDDEYRNYEKMIEEHNKLVEEYNSFAKETGTRWYVVPVPSGHTKSAAH